MTLKAPRTVTPSPLEAAGFFPDISGRIRQMSEAPAKPPSTPAARPITVQQEWILIGVFAAICVGTQLLGYFEDPARFVAGKGNFFSVVSALSWWLGHGVWLSMDRRRRGLEMGRWRYGVLFFGVLAIWLYLALEYRSRALYLIPLTCAIYAVMVVVFMGILVIAVGI